MPSTSVHLQVKQAIDAQDTGALKELLNQNPGLDLEDFTPNHLSALWLALNPPAGKGISGAVIECLLDTGRINPALMYDWVTPRVFVATVYPQERTIHHRIRWRENQYIQEHRARPGARADENAGQRFAADRQNTHDSVVVKATDDSIVSLYQRYNGSAQPDQSLEDFLNQLLPDDGLSEQEIIAAQKACRRIMRQSETREYELPSKQKVHLTNRQVQELLWQAVNDTRPEAFVHGTDMSASETLIRKRLFAKHLAMSQNEYGPDNPACWMGTRNQMVSCMDAIHCDVRIAQELPITEESIGEHYTAYCKSRLEELARREPDLFREYLRYYALRGLPGGCRLEETVPEALKDWVTQVHDQFADTVRTEYRDTKPEKKQIEPEKLDSLLDYLRDPLCLGEAGELETLLVPGLNHLSALLFTLFAQGMPLGDKLFGDSKAAVSEYVHQLITAHCARKQTPPSVAFVQTIASEAADYLQSAIIPERLKNLLLESESASLWKPLFDQLNPEQTAVLLNNLSAKAVQLLAIGQRVTEPCCFWQTLVEELSERWGQEHSFIKWLGTLPESLRQQFLNNIAIKYGYPLNAIGESALMEEAFSLGLAEGYLSHFKIGKPITIRGRDLRGVDLKQVDLSNIEFENCDLRCTFLFGNPTLKASHIENNRVDELFCHHAVQNKRSDTLKIAMSTPKIVQFLQAGLIKFLCESWAWRQSLIMPMMDSIINSPYFNKELFLQHKVLINLIKNRAIPDVIKLALESRNCTSDALYVRDERGTIIDTVLLDTLSRLLMTERDREIFNYLLESPKLTPEIFTARNSQGNLFSYKIFTARYYFSTIESFYNLVTHKYTTEQMAKEAIDIINSRIKRLNSHQKNYLNILKTYLRLPQNYSRIYNAASGSDLDKACALLKDYAKNNSSTLRFLSGHWNRHYISDVNRVLRRVNNKEINTVDELLTVLLAVKPANRAGSLSARIIFIMKEHNKALPAQAIADAPDADAAPPADLQMR
ncbi:DUF5617 domain-containing protein [Legionella dresdenensis]|uniref:DUF5617 domain-containing protein n=1 Tax=Legionella dresdenensis TaxID=450200 RepID=A0ABV8CH02_9GAMM